MNTTALAANIRVGVDALRIHPLRTMLSVLGIIIGSASLVAIMSVSDGIMSFVRGKIETQTSVQVISVGSRTADFRGGQWIPITNYPVFSESDAEAARREIPGVAAATLLLSGSTTARFRGTFRRVQATLGGADLPEFGELRLVSGRFFSPVEAARGGDVVVINHALARELAPEREPESLLDQEIRIGQGVQRIIGVLARNPYEDPRNPQFSAYLPIRAVHDVLAAPANGRMTPTIQLKASSVEGVGGLRLAVADWLAQRYVRWQDRIKVDVALERLVQAEQGILLSKLFLGALVGISLVVGGIGIMNVMLASITERTREVGIRKALGARRSDIRNQFLAESFAIAAAGTLIGLLLGGLLSMAITAGFRYFTGAPVYPVLSLSTFLVAVGSSSIVGLAFGTYPAQRAARLQPIDAIAHE